MPRPRMCKEQENWLINNVSGKDWKTITEMFNAEFGASKKLSTLRSYANRTLGINTGRNTHFYKGMKQWNEGLSKEEWQSHFTEDSWNRYINRQITGNKCDVSVGSKHFGGNAWMIKTDDGWKRMSRYIYESINNVELTDDDIIILLDGNNENFDADNLYKTNKRIAGRTYKTFGKIDGNSDRLLLCLKSMELADLIGI